MDVLLVPTAPRVYTIAEVAADPILTNSRLGTYTNFVNLLDLCALAVPAGFRSDGVPWGVTMIARAWQEGLLLELGGRWEDSGKRTKTEPGRASTANRNRCTPAGPDACRPAKQVEEATIPLAVVGAHLSGLPLNHQLVGAGARLMWSGRTAPQYRLYALPGTVPPKPGMIRVTEGGAAIAVEVWELTAEAFGRFVAAVPPPLCIGSIALDNDETVKGFLCEPAALAHATDITSYGDWRAFTEASARSERC